MLVSSLLLNEQVNSIPINKLISDSRIVYKYIVEHELKTIMTI